MSRRPPRSTRTDTLFPYTTLFRSLARPRERLDEAVPDRRPAVDGDVAGHAQLRRARLDGRALFGVDAAGICEHRVHRPAALLQPRHAEAGVEAATEGQDDVGGAGIGDWGFEIRESGLLRHEGIDRKSTRLNSSH